MIHLPQDGKVALDSRAPGLPSPMGAWRLDSTPPKKRSADGSPRFPHIIHLQMIISRKSLRSDGCRGMRRRSPLRVKLGQAIVVVLPDSGERHLSSVLLEHVSVVKGLPVVAKT